MKTVSIIILIIVFLLLYSLCVHKTIMYKKTELSMEYHEGEISKVEFENRMKENTFFSTFLDFPEVLRAIR